LNTDVKKIPINWFSYRSDDTFNAQKAPTDSDVGTLSWVAATQLDPDLQGEPALERLRTAGQHPFTSFIDPDAFSHADALGILCASKFKAKIGERYHVDCAQHPRGNAQIEGRVIVIGEDVSGRDRHALFGNDVSGAYLQANYIESLLDGRYLRPFGAGWDLIVFAAWLVFLYLIFWIQPEIALAISLAIGFLVKYLIVQLVVWKGLYPQIWIQDLGALALLLKYIDSRGHRIIEAIEKRWFHHPPPGGPGAVASTADPRATTSPGTVPKAS
jgi:CHASE2 domain-containing sensor protein